MQPQTKIPLFLFGKIIFLFTIGIYVLVLPIYTIKFGLVDGLNIYGYISPNWVLQLENSLCVTLSLISFAYCGITIKKLIKQIWSDKPKNEK